jgi:outer membrane protein OmpU
MNNIKKIGLSALAGSLVAFSAQAAELSVSGTAEATYVSKGGTGGATAHTGNPMGLNTGITLTGTGDVNGYDVTLTTVLADGHGSGRSSSSLTIDMGDMGQVGFDQGVGLYGIGTVENKIPSAWEEPDHGMTDMHQIDVNGAGNVVGYKNTFAGAGVSIELQPGVGGTAAGDGGSTVATGTEYNLAVNYSPADGVTLWGGYANESTNGADDDTEMTAAIQYATGPITVGYQRSTVDPGSGASTEVEAMGVAFAVNDNLSISYGSTENTRDATATAVEASSEATAINAAYTMGSAAIKVAMGEQDNQGYTANKNAEYTEVSLSLSF